MRKLLAEGLPVDPRNVVGRTPLIEASASHLPEILDLLLEAGADPNAADVGRVTSLMAAIGAQSTFDSGEFGPCGWPMKPLLEEARIIRSLFAHGADVERREVAGRTAVFYAAMKLNDRAFDHLASAGAR